MSRLAPGTASSRPEGLALEWVGGDSGVQRPLYSSRSRRSTLVLFFLSAPPALRLRAELEKFGGQGSAQIHCTPKDGASKREVGSSARRRGGRDGGRGCPRSLFWRKRQWGAGRPGGGRDRWGKGSRRPACADASALGTRGLQPDLRLPQAGPERSGALSEDLEPPPEQ